MHAFCGFNICADVVEPLYQEALAADPGAFHGQ